MNCRKWIARYLQFHRAEGNSAKTLDWRWLSLGQFADYLDATLVSRQR